ncbi:aminotransferase-like domain-containing protein [Aspergillus puulaauensis]|uniref:aromatic-amino-acid transaminase n=1 Tax=Aspergillus puulaauensis TaxID=1220207 RepID=A0A7R8ARG0_9EURO|nr:aromatic/aminoadipate aminotransferase 1 [Aspergillus puulaauensis]BCS26590.1 aromatic/aminoadipate aminotransferase 1 [Aspergillus puulaauensis]
MSPPAALDVDANGNGVPKQLTVDGIAAVRAQSAKMPAGVAPSTSSDVFKSPACYTKPKAKRFDDLLTLEAKARKESTLKGAARYLKNPGLISLGGGLPSPEYFPIEEVSIKVPTPPKFSHDAAGDSLVAGKYDIREGKSLYDLEVCLNYGQATGSPQLLRFVTEHTELIHNPPYSDWQCCLTAGSTYAWDTALRLLCEKGDYLLMEEYTFSSAQETALPQGVKVAPVKMDEQGLLPDALNDVMSNWDETARGGRKPRVLYTIPTGQNPTGATQSLERRKEIYKVAQKHNLYIIEDEPYYFLQMQPYTGANSEPVPPPANHEDFIKSLIPSYLSLDVDGRVLRMESFSKVLTPGSRTGWIVASEQIVERFIRNTEVSAQHPSGISQLIIFKLLDEHWGHTGYLDWLINLRMEYTSRRDIIVQACEKHLPQEISNWIAPAAGMFHWIEVDWKKHPEITSGKTRDAIEETIFGAAVSNGVLVSRGSWFKAAGRSEERMFFRATFAAASEENITEAIKRFGDSLRTEFKL